MASRENQGLIASLLVFVGLTVVLFVVSYYFWKTKVEAQEEKATAVAARTSAEANLNQARAENRALKEMIGYQADAPLSDIQAGHAEDMQKYGQLLRQPVDNYHALVGLFVPQWIDAHNTLVELERQVEELTADRDAARTEEVAAVQQAETARDQATRDYTLAREDFRATLTDTLREGELAQQEIALLRGQVAEAGHQLQEATDAFERQVNNDRQRQEALQTIIRTYQGDVLDAPDGQVTFVSQHANVVYINVGADDYLQPQMTFSVYERTAGNLAQAEQKGAIEITRILEAHQAEARIISDVPTDPILSGDLIFSPVWQPGQQVHFALAGFMDIDGDGESDLELVQHLIALNGGAIDAMIDEDGNRTGEMSLQTRYVVQGERPTAETAESSLQAYTLLLDKAHELGIPPIPLDRLLELLGYRGSERSIGLGEHANPEDFHPRSQRGNFRERRPPSSIRFGT